MAGRVGCSEFSEAFGGDFGPRDPQGLQLWVRHPHQVQRYIIKIQLIVYIKVLVATNEE